MSLIFALRFSFIEFCYRNNGDIHGTFRAFPGGYSRCDAQSLLFRAQCALTVRKHKLLTVCQAGLQKILSAFQEQAHASAFEGESCLFPC